MTVSMFSCEAMRLRGGLVVPGEHDDFDAGFVHRRDRRSGRPADCVGESDDPCRPAVHGNQDRRSPRRRQFLPLFGHGADVNALGGHELAVAYKHLASLDRCSGAVPGNIAEVRGGQGGHASVRRHS